MKKKHKNKRNSKSLCQLWIVHNHLISGGLGSFCETSYNCLKQTTYTIQPVGTYLNYWLHQHPSNDNTTFPFKNDWYMLSHLVDATNPTTTR